MKDFLKGLLALPFVLIGGFTVYWVGAILFAVVGGIIGLVVVLAPYVLRFVGIVLIIAFAIWGLGNLVMCPVRCKNAKNDPVTKNNVYVYTPRARFGIISARC